MTDRELARHIIATNDWMRVVYFACLSDEKAKINYKNRYAAFNTPEMVEGRAWDQAKVVLARMQERAQ